MTNITMKRIYLFFTLLLIAMPSMANTTSSVENDTTPMLDSVVATTQLKQSLSKDNIIAQMNYCTNALTNIIHNKSIAVLDYESNQLINNLTMEQACSIYEIREYRSTLLGAIGKFQITEEERQLMRKIQSFKQDNLKWQSLSNALNPTMLVTGGGKTGIQLAFQATLAAARTAVEYKVASNELAIETLEALWELRKEDMDGINDARVEAQKVILDLYHSHGLQEYDRLTEQTANELLTYTSEPNAQKRIRLLETNKKKYVKYAPYYYYLGMAYVDNNEYNKAKPIFQHYKKLYNASPIFRYDNMSGCIALTMLTYEKNLTKEQKIELINTVRNNLPHNSAAHLQCAMVYIYELKEEEKGLEMLLSSIDDPFASDQELLYLAIANLAKMINNYPMLQSQIEESMANESIIQLDNYLLYHINKEDNAWDKINKIIRFEDVSSRQIKSGFLAKDFDKNLSINIPSRFVMNEGDAHVVICNYTKTASKTDTFTIYNDNYISITDIESVNCFKEDKKLKYLYVEEITKDETYVLRDVDIDKIKNETFPRQSEFTITERDIKDIVSFCKKHALKNTEYTTWKLNDSATLKKVANITLTYYFPIVSTGVVLYEKYMQEGLYFSLHFNNNIQLVYKYDTDKKDLVGCYYQYKEKVVFASPEMEKEFYDILETTKEQVSTDSTEESNSTKLLITSIKGWFKKDSTANDPIAIPNEDIVQEEVQSETEKNDSTKSGVFQYFKKWF